MPLRVFGLLSLWLTEIFESLSFLVHSPCAFQGLAPQRHSRALTHLLHVAKSGVGAETLQRSPCGRVDLVEEHLAVGYQIHPAVVDSSMHLSMFVGMPDGKTRVPGKHSSGSLSQDDSHKNCKADKFYAEPSLDNIQNHFTKWTQHFSKLLALCDQI